MEGSNSQKLRNERDFSKILTDIKVKYEDVVQSFKGFWLGKDGHSSHKGEVHKHEATSNFDSSSYYECSPNHHEIESYNQTEKLLETYRGWMLWLMADKEIDFQILVDTCDDQQFNTIIEEVFSQKEFFLYISFCRQGANSIVKLIKRIKKEDHAFTLAKILSTKCYAMMTHHEARIVIQQCLNVLGDETNEVLIEQIIQNNSYLATHAVGCISLNECIDTISGAHRIRLLNRIANITDVLSSDPYGSYVVNHVIELKYSSINAKIVSNLRGNIISLSQIEGGSYVIEKCLELSDFGLITVVRDILSFPTAPLALARDKFGSYIIQKALLKTKERGFIDLHESLEKALEPYYDELDALYRSWGDTYEMNLVQEYEK